MDVLVWVTHIMISLKYDEIRFQFKLAKFNNFWQRNFVQSLFKAFCLLFIYCMIYVIKDFEKKK